MSFNQSESIRLDSQLRGWFQNSSYNEETSLSHFGGGGRGSSSEAVRGSTEAVGNNVGGGGKGLTGGIYHMLIAEQNLREKAAAAKRQP
jgi:hypothetical protein